MLYADGSIADRHVCLWHTETETAASFRFALMLSDQFGVSTTKSSNIAQMGF